MKKQQNKLFNKKKTIREFIGLISRKLCVNCMNCIDIKNYHIPLCRKCRELYLNEYLT